MRGRPVLSKAKKTTPLDVTAVISRATESSIALVAMSTPTTRAEAPSTGTATA
jgi:hypothetical protein